MFEVGSGDAGLRTMSPDRFSQPGVVADMQALRALGGRRVALNTGSAGFELGSDLALVPGLRPLSANLCARSTTKAYPAELDHGGPHSR